MDVSKLPIFPRLASLANKLPWEWPIDFVHFFAFMFDGWAFVGFVLLVIVVFGRTKPRSATSPPIIFVVCLLLFYLRLDATYWRNDLVFGANSRTALEVGFSILFLLITAITAIDGRRKT